MSHMDRAVGTIASYRQRNGAWPTEIRLGPDQVAWISEEYGPSGLRRIGERMTFRVDPGEEISVGGREVHRYEDASLSKVDEGAPNPMTEAFDWLGLEPK